MKIQWVNMTRPYFTGGRPGPIRALVIHATAGTNSLPWLRQGGSSGAPVSCHYLVSKAGGISQFVKDEDTAWHAGASRWNGLEVNGSLNAVSLGIELENLNNGHDPYPPLQLAAAAELSRSLMARYGIDPANLVRHRDISPGRKTDPAPPSFDWPSFRAAVLASEPVTTADAYTADSPILGQPRGTVQQAVSWFVQRSKHYAPRDIATIVAAYERVGSSVGLDWFLALAQCAHETGSLSSALSARPVRNPAGIGVTGAASHTPRYGYVWDADRNTYRAACMFLAWTPEEARGTVSSVEAHIGRLLAYAVPPSQRFGPVTALIDKALSVRPLSIAVQGTAPTLKPLGSAHNPTGQSWAHPGENYGAAIAAIANRMRGL
jgi:N-acetyl-anhydromuramyl-L-alanine amidase AmpD